MKRPLPYLLVLMLLTSSCSSAADDAGLQSAGRCGDGVCDGPETVDICPQDCSLPSSTGNEPAGQDPSASDAAEGIFGEVYVEVLVQRQDGVGTCGSAPWGVDHVDGGDYSCPPPKYWYGYDLLATALQYVQITPTAGGSWLFSADEPGGGTYQRALHWSDGQRVCEPVSIEGRVFEFDVEGSYRDGQIELHIEARPIEVSQWGCDGGNAYERETTLLLIDWAVAMTGDYTDLAATLATADASGLGAYRREYIADMNPSPQDRDHVEARVEFSCMVDSGGGVYTGTACPWDN